MEILLNEQIPRCLETLDGERCQTLSLVSEYIIQLWDKALDLKYFTLCLA